ncbi:hypothetical protein EV174_006571, partial [Coemansia sp. RSA 2320]
RLFTLSSSSTAAGVKGGVTSSSSTATEPGDAKGVFGRARRGSTAASTRGLGIVAAPADPPHRRSLSESPYMNAKVLHDQMPGGLTAVPEEGEASIGSRDGASKSGRPAGDGVARIPASPFSHAASLGSGMGAADLTYLSSAAETQPAVPPPYGSSQVDNGDEVQLAIEVCKIKNLNNFFIVHLSRRKGNVWAYKHLYHLIIEKLALRSDDRRRYVPRP